MICRIITLLLLTASLAACAFHKPSQKLVEVEEAAIDRNAKLIEQQQSVLESQSVKLEELAAIQQDLGGALAEIQQTLTQVRELAAYDAAGVPVPSKLLKSVPVVERVPDTKGEREPPQVRNGIDKTVLGRNEWVWVDLLNLVLKARVDTGVLISSISAQNIQPFERNGEKWVSFSLAGDESGTTYESPLTRYAKVKTASEKQVRLAVISLRVHLGDLIEETEFVLSDRESTVYPVLLGRAFLRDIAVVDVSRQFIYSKKKLLERIQTLPNQTVQQ